MPQERGVTLRSIAFGLCLSVAVGLLGNWVRFVLSGSFMSYSHMPMGNLILFLLSILICAPLAWGLGRRFVFSPTEWVTIFCMGFIGSLGPTYGSSGDLVGFMVAPHYFATPENEWAAFLHPYMPGWLIPKNEGDAMVWFYKGVPQGASIPWGVWAVPLVWWFLFICAVGFACVCVSTLFHRQWSENEKLVYPALAPIVDMTTRVGSGKWFFPEFMQGKAFWAGFGLTASVLGWNMVSWFYPLFPSIPLGPKTWVAFSRHDPSIYIFLSTVVISFSYFATLEILFSIWFFDLLFVIEGGVLNRLGLNIIYKNHYGGGHYAWQTAGAFLSLGLWGVWIARLHLRGVIQKALNPPKFAPDGGNDLLSYRAAFIGLIVSCLYMAVWLGRAGLEVKVILLLIPSMLLVYITLAKFVADSGLIYLDLPTSTLRLPLMVLGGANALQASSHAVLGISSRIVSHHNGFAMPVMAHINRLGERISNNKRRFFWSVCAAFVTGLVTSTLFLIWLAYTRGADSFGPNFLIQYAERVALERVVTNIKGAKPIALTDYGFFLIGAGAMACLNLMRYRFVWWPIHPIGFALSGNYLARQTSFTIFVAWLLKLLMLKLAGAAFYRKSRPFFIGLLIGYILAVAAGVIVDAIWFQPLGQQHRLDPL